MRAGERALFEILMRRYNQRLYRTVRAIVKDEGAYRGCVAVTSP